MEDAIAEEAVHDQQLSEASSSPSTTRSHAMLYETRRPLLTSTTSFRDTPTRRFQRVGAYAGDVGAQSQSLRSSRSIARTTGDREANIEGVVGARLSTSAFLNTIHS